MSGNLRCDSASIGELSPDDNSIGDGGESRKTGKESATGSGLRGDSNTLSDGWGDVGGCGVGGGSCDHVDVTPALLFGHAIARALVSPMVVELECFELTGRWNCVSKY